MPPKYRRKSLPSFLDDAILRQMTAVSRRRRSVERRRWAVDKSVVPRKFFGERALLSADISTIASFSELLHKRIEATTSFLESARGNPELGREVAEAQANLLDLNRLSVHLRAEFAFLKERMQRGRRPIPEALLAERRREATASQIRFTIRQLREMLRSSASERRSRSRTRTKSGQAITYSGEEKLERIPRLGVREREAILREIETLTRMLETERY